MNCAAEGGWFEHPASSRAHTVKAIHKIPRAIVYKIEYLGKNWIHSIQQFAGFII
jgi:hypothetical protein